MAVQDPEPKPKPKQVHCLCGRILFIGPTGFFVCEHCDAGYDHPSHTCQSCRTLDTNIKLRTRIT